MSIQAINVRNQFRGKVREIIRGDVVSEVDVEAPWGIVTSVITTRSVDDLAVGRGLRRGGAGEVDRGLDRQAVSCVRNRPMRMQPLVRLAGLCMALVLATAPVLAQNGRCGPHPRHPCRRDAADAVAVRERSGATVELVLPATATVQELAAVGIAATQPQAVVDIAAVPGPEGVLPRALAVLVLQVLLGWQR